MRFQAFILILSTLSLFGCGADVSSNRKGSTTNTRQSAQGESTTPLIIPSGMFREKATQTLYYTNEAKIPESSREEVYRPVPRMEIDDEGADTGSIRTRTGLGRPELECGLTIDATFQERVTECAKLNGTTANWSGVNYGNSTEGRWDLVALKKLESKNIEIWVDRKTGMVWSDVQRATNWCEASGNDQNEVADSLKVDCQKLNKNSICHDKLILGLAHFKWRLPTRNDYLQADLDGIRFVLKKGNGLGFWTATLSAKSMLREHAWVYFSDSSGTLAVENLNAVRESRCIGAITK